MKSNERKSFMEEYGEKYGHEGFVAALFIMGALLVMLLGVATAAYYSRPPAINIQWEQIEVVPPEEGTEQYYSEGVFC